MRVLREGDAGADVTALQQRLRERLFNPGEIDGHCVLATQAAVMSVQLSAGLLADGIVGPRTARALGLAEPDCPRLFRP